MSDDDRDRLQDAWDAAQAEPALWERLLPARVLLLVALGIGLTAWVIVQCVLDS